EKFDALPFRVRFQAVLSEDFDALIEEAETSYDIASRFRNEGVAGKLAGELVAAINGRAASGGDSSQTEILAKHAVDIAAVDPGIDAVSEHPHILREVLAEPCAGFVAGIVGYIFPGIVVAMQPVAIVVIE